MLVRTEIKVSPAEISDILDQHMVALSVTWAREYQKDGRTFITCFLKYPSLLKAAGFVVQSYRRLGALQEAQNLGRDFTGYVEKLDLSERYMPLMANLLLIIYSITHETL